jgi:hypothetical protein
MLDGRYQSFVQLRCEIPTVYKAIPGRHGGTAGSLDCPTNDDEFLETYIRRLRSGVARNQV